MSVYRALQATRFLPSVAGAAPYSLSRSLIKFSRIGFVSPFIQLLGFACHFYFNSGDIPTKKNLVKNILLTAASWLQCIIAVYGILKDALCQKNIIDIVRSMETYDKRSGYANDNIRKRENERVRLWSYAYSAVIVVFAIVRYLTWRNIRYFIVVEIWTVQIDNGIYMFAVLTTLLGLRLRHLHSTVEEARVTAVREKGCASKSFDPADPEYIRELYTNLYATGERLNDHYSERLLLWSAQAMFTFITQTYRLIVEDITALRVAATIVDLLSVGLGLLTFCSVCQFTVGQANKITSALLEKNIRHTARINRGRKEIFAMSLYMALRPLGFSALGFFSVDFSLTYAIVTTTATYLILCMQTDSDDDQQYRQTR